MRVKIKGAEHIMGATIDVSAYEKSRLLGVRTLAKIGLRRGAYDGGNGRRFVLFHPAGNGNEYRSEFTSKLERDNFALSFVAI